MKIIVADDSSTIRLIQQKALNELGYTDLLLVDCGEDVLSTLKQHPDVDLILMDWNMPLMNGFDCLRAIRSNPATKDIKVIMVSAEAQKSRIIEAIQGGATNYLLKPFDKEKLREVIDSCFNSPR